MSPKQQKNDDQEPQVEVNSWGEWANHVLTELKRLNSVQDEVRKDITSNTIELAQLKVKSSIWGAAAGMITVLSVLGISYLTGALSGDRKQSNPDYPPYPPHPTQQTYYFPKNQVGGSNGGVIGYYLVPIPTKNDSTIPSTPQTNDQQTQTPTKVGP